MKQIESELASQMQRVAAIENADYSISAAAMAQMDSEEFSDIFKELDK